MKTDSKRARFRADSTPFDDKLKSCLRLNCHGIRSRMPRASASTRKRARKTYRDASSDEDGSEGASDSGVEEITGKENTAKKPLAKKASKGKGKEKAREEGGDGSMEVDHHADSATRAGTPRDKPTDKLQTGSDPAPKRRGRPPKPKAITDTGRAASPTPKRRGRLPKSKAFIEDSDVEAAGGRKASASPVRQSRTRSASRGRPAAKTPKSRKKGEEDVEMHEDKPAKKRKIAA